ncbi:ARM repeat-containing protein [Xylaria sp. FL1777]|nr:ARM repeat-containing protein [Xylaria sp. FL1777]
MAPPGKSTQNPGSLGGSAWQQSIWGISGPINSHRETANSRGSDEVSPTAPSGSAQLNPLSEPAGWASRGIWKHTNTSPNNVSPVHTKNNFSYTLSDASHGLYNVRHSISQGASVIPNRTMPPGPVESPTSSSRYIPVVGTLAGDERGSSGIYYTQGGSQLGLDAAAIHRRKSADPGFLGAVHSRSGTFSGRQPETSTSTLAGQLREPASYSFSKGVHTNSEQRRPSSSNVPVTMSSETTRGQVLNLSNDNAHAEFNEAFGRGLTLEDTTESLNGYTSNGYNSTSHQFQPNPSSQSWQHEINNNSRNFSHGAQQETWNDAPHASYPNAKRGSVERSSPAGSSYRTHLNSPRNLSGTPNQRTSNSWNQPVPRNPIVSQDLDRQQQGAQYPQQSSGFYQPYFPQYPTSYEHYTQHVPNYRPQVPANGYGVPLNYIGLPLQTNRDKAPVQSARSPLLDEFRAQTKANRRYELKEIYGHIVEFSGDQHGSRFIQDKLVVANSEEKDRVFGEIEPNGIQLMKDVFGNYVIQKFFEHGDLFQKKLLAGQMAGKVADLSVQMYSCRVVQKALDHVLVEQQREIIDELRPDIVHVAKDQNGNHVVQKIIQLLPQHCIPYILDAFQGQVEQLASHGYACRVIQRILEHGTAAERKRLMADIHASTGKLLTDQYGNYVIQHIISHGESEDRCAMIKHVIERALALSKHKYASNVVEKCIEFGTDEERSAIRAKLTTTSSDGTNPLQALIKDQFGNYVIQKMIEFLHGPEKLAFVSDIKGYIPLVKRQGAGRQNTGLDRLFAAVEAVSSTSDANGSAAIPGTTPSTPSLAVEVNSAVPTPSLTTEQSSPQSSSPPSTNISTTDEANEETKAAHISRPDKVQSLIRVQET